MAERLSKALARYRQRVALFHQRRDEAHRLMKADPTAPVWHGRTATYDMLYEVTEENPQIPTDVTPVSRKAIDVLSGVRQTLVPYTDAVLTRDRGNQVAVADVVVDGVTLAENVPAVTLLAWEQDYSDLLTLVKEIPEAPAGAHWTPDATSNALNSDTSVKLRNEKKRFTKVIVEPTQYQSAVIDTYTNDVPVAHQNVVLHFGGLTTAQKREWVESTEKVVLAIKQAREEANAAFETEYATGAGEALLNAALPGLV